MTRARAAADHALHAGATNRLRRFLMKAARSCERARRATEARRPARALDEACRTALGAMLTAAPDVARPGF